MATLRLSLVVLAALIAASTAQPTAPAPAPTGGVNLTAILEKAGQYTTFIRLLNTTQVGQQVNNQLNQSTEGMTVFAPTDNAFQTLKPGSINGLTTQQQVQLILYHVLPKYYTFETFQTASNPVRTQATGNDGKPFEITVTYLGVNNVNVSTGVVTVGVNNALSSKFPLAVFQVDKVLLPEELFGSDKAPKSAPAGSDNEPAGGPESDGGSAGGPSSTEGGKSGGFGIKSFGFGGVFAIVLGTMGLLL